MIFNIRDHRSNPFRWKRVQAIIEATSHDNTVQGSVQVDPAQDDVFFQERNGISLQEAIAWADAQPSAVTLYLYDEGAGTSSE